jgi:hypothetical protein
MKRPFTSSSILVCLSILVFASVAVAAPVSWTDWTSAIVGNSGSAQGTLTIGPTTVDVSYSGAISFAQTSGGTNYWNPSAPYISATVENAPPASDIIALNIGTGATPATITFSQAVQDPLLALVSWNGNTVDFGVPIEILSYGAGYWGNGTPVLNAAGTGFFGSGEVHGVIELPGSYTSISFTHTSENWHGFTVGVFGLGGPASVPEPATMLLLGAGLIGLAAFGRKKLR